MGGTRLAKEVADKAEEVAKKAKECIEQASGTGDKIPGGKEVAEHSWEDPDLGRKLEYVYGKATGAQHNIDRSVDMLRQMERIGLPDTPESREYLARQLGEVLNNPNNITSCQEGGRVIRESLLMGPDGAVKMETVGRERG